MTVTTHQAERALRPGDFDFDLPWDRVAAHPPERRGDVRLLVLHRQSGRVEHRRFPDIIEYLKGETVYVNNSKLRRAWITLRRSMGQDERIYLIRRLGEGRWLAYHRIMPELARSGRFTTVDGIGIRFEEQVSEDRWELQFERDPDLAKIGTLRWDPPVRPPRNAEEERLYETPYARVEGSFMAPTAGVHFTEEMLGRLRVRELTLHVETSTWYRMEEGDFKPGESPLEAEYYEIPEPPSVPVVAAGTTVTKALETGARTGERTGWSDLFIYPPFEFRTVKALLTNLHRPRETLLGLTCAFGGYGEVMGAYAEAIEKGYLFSDYGDAMLIL